MAVLDISVCGWIQAHCGGLYLDAKSQWIAANHAPYRRVEPPEAALWGEV